MTTLATLLAIADTQRVDRRPTPIDLDWAEQLLQTPAGRATADVFEAVADGTDCQCQRALDRAEAMAGVPVG